MEMTSIINQYYDAYMNKYGDTALPGHLKALNAIRSCRKSDDLVKSIEMAKEKVLYTRFSVWPGLK